MTAHRLDKIVLAVDDPSTASEVRAAIGPHPAVEVVALTMAGLRRAPGIDALLMLSPWAHERYGGVPVSGEAQVLTTQGEPDSPPYVVTTAPGSLVLSESGAWQAAGDSRPVGGDYDGVVAAIAEHNQRSPDRPIRTLGVHPGLLGSSMADAAREARALRDALL